MSHTKGPWRSQGAYILGAPGTSGTARRVVAELPSFGGPWTDEDEANARLIAAAPALRDALADMLAGWRYIREVHGDLPGVGWDRAQAKAEAALAQAEGQRP